MGAALTSAPAQKAVDRAATAVGGYLQKKFFFITFLSRYMCLD